jgi:DNA-binding MarR family transcriptional regulator
MTPLIVAANNPGLQDRQGELYDATMASDQDGDGEGAAAGHGWFPDDVLSRLLRRLVRFGSLLEPHDHGGIQASMSEVLALGEIAAAVTLSQQQLADLLALEKSTVSRLVTGMEQRGWLIREREPANRRFTRLRLTSDGEDAAARIAQDLRDRHRTLFSGLTPLEREALTVGLSALARSLEQHSPLTRAGEGSRAGGDTDPIGPAYRHLDQR